VTAATTTGRYTVEAQKGGGYAVLDTQDDNAVVYTSRKRRDADSWAWVWNTTNLKPTAGKP
jgi:hypothetical protein